ncbi:MAG: Fic family protein [Chloroflexi bacterium]|nr:Fic family protein [Chloroflexota bacterium]
MTSANPGSTRAGHFVRQPAGFTAFVPAPLPPSPPLILDDIMLALLSDAGMALGRLDGVTETLPNPSLFVAMYVRREAVLSSQIEGTESTLEDILEYELDAKGRELPRDIEEVVNYVSAMSYGIDRLDTLPLSLRLIREIHAELLRDVRGSDRRPGEFRSSQNWIGPPGATIAQATFVPPTVEDMKDALDKFEKFMHNESQLPLLLHVGLAHAQFETIHPFLDGNGRVGRLLITFLLYHRNALRKPLLYLSHYFRSKRAEYYDRLTAIRKEGHWEGWLKFFLGGVLETAREAVETARAIVLLRAEHEMLLRDNGVGITGLNLLNLLFDSPLVTVARVSERLEISYGTANSLIGQFADFGMLQETTGQKRNRRFSYGQYLALFEDDETPVVQEESEATATPGGKQLA